MFKIINKILDFIFPQFCVGCYKKETSLCDGCLSKIPLSSQNNEPNIFSIFEYQNKIIKKAIWALKYKNNEVISSKLAQVIYDKLLEELVDLKAFNNFEKPLLIPIPLSKNRLKQRGFNQSEVIVQKLSFIDESLSPILNVLYKIKDTPSQTSIKDKNERKLNIKDCFEIRGSEIIKNQNIILIDDVTTTGATLSEAKKVLIEAGAKKVIAFTVAH